jgi:nucleotide-binding universal stress UspA family protein
MSRALRALSVMPLRIAPLPAQTPGHAQPAEATRSPASPATSPGTEGPTAATGRSPAPAEPVPATGYRDDVRSGRRVYGRVVVGYDGSPGARLAMAVAVEEARRRDATLTVVNVWHGDPLTMLPSVRAARDDDMRRAAEEELAGATSGLELEGVRLELLTLEGNAPRRLEEVGRQADLLVVGSRGHGALASTLLGSVSLHCVLHAPCPVLVVPPERRRF